MNKREFTTSAQVYSNCLNTHSNSIVNKNLVKTHESNIMRIAARLSTVGIKGTSVFVPTGPVIPVPLKNRF